MQREIPMPTYDNIISDFAGVLASFMRGAAQAGRQGDVYVWAIHTTAEHDGGLYVGFDAPAGIPLSRLEVARPVNGLRWAEIPYSGMRSALWHACRSLPILPIPRAA